MPNPNIKIHPIKNTTPGTIKQFESIHYNSNIPGPKVYLQAGIHSDELPGILLLQHLKKEIDTLFNQGLVYGEIIIVPFANPIGLGQNINGEHLGRFDLDFTGNFNRNFFNLTPYINDYIIPLLTDDLEQNTKIIRSIFKEKINNYQPNLESEHLKKELLLLACDADYVFDLHCDTRSIMHIYSNHRHEETAEILAYYLESPILLLENTPNTFAFDEAVTSPWWQIKHKLKSLNINKPIGNVCFASTIELRGKLNVSDTLSKKDSKNLLSFLNHIGSLSYKEVQGKKIKPQKSSLDTVDVVKSPHSGIIVFYKELGESVAKGDHIADLITIDSKATRTPIYTKTDGILFTITNNHFTRSGYIIAKIAGTTKLANYENGLLAP